MGLTFKENCPDLRNTKVVDIVKELQDYDCKVDVYDPWINAANAKDEYKISLVEAPSANAYDGIILAVNHRQFKEMGIDKIREFGTKNHILYDLKYLFPADLTDLRL